MAIAGERLTADDEGADRPPDDLCLEYGRPALVFGGVVVDKLPIGNVIGVGYVFGQAAIHKVVGSAPQFLAPRPVF